MSSLLLQGHCRILPAGQTNFELSFYVCGKPAIIKVSPVHGDLVSRGKSGCGFCYGVVRVAKLTGLHFSAKQKGVYMVLLS